MKAETVSQNFKILVGSNGIGKNQSRDDTANQYITARSSLINEPLKRHNKLVDWIFLNFGT